MQAHGGELWYSCLGPTIYLVINKPEIVADVLNYKAKFYRKFNSRDKSKEIFGNGVGNAQGAQWKRQRKALGPTFKYSVIKESIPLIKGIINKYFEKWEKSLNIQNLGEETNKIAFDISTQLLFGGNFLEDFQARYQQHPITIFQQLSERFAKQKYKWQSFFPRHYRQIPLPQNLILDKELKMLRDAAKLALKSRLEFKTTKWDQLSEDMDFLDTVIAHTDQNAKRQSSTDPNYLEQDRPMDQEEMVDQVLNFLIQSFAPTGRYLEYLLMCLSLHPDQQEIIFNEFKQIQQNEKNKYLPYDEQLVMQSKLANFSKEVLRMYPPTSESEFRIALQDHFITDGKRKYFIPKNAVIKISAYGTQMNPMWWENPKEFKPERFENQKFHPYAFLAFSAGPRVCLGKNYGLMFGKVMLIEFLKRFKITNKVNPKFVQKLHMESLVPVQLKLEKRQQV